jgi:hypothetical protein
MVHWVPVLADSQTTVRLRLKTRVSLDSTSKRRCGKRENVLGVSSATRKLSRSGVRGHFSTILQPITRPLGRQAFHPKENSCQGPNPLFKLGELQTLTTSPAQVCEQHTDVADCTRLSESTP